MMPVFNIKECLLVMLVPPPKKSSKTKKYKAGASQTQAKGNGHLMSFRFA
uniref:Uncharacterized protein n=1 Tax=Lotus japonicus TaxID=34305 RepID=I3T9N8_LOTJA|nr:unknown [Lotus japonicus]